MKPAACRCGHQPGRHRLPGCAGGCPCRVYLPAAVVCRCCGNDAGPYDGLCLDCLESGAA